MKFGDFGFGKMGFGEMGFGERGGHLCECASTSFEYDPDRSEPY